MQFRILPFEEVSPAPQTSPPFDQAGMPHAAHGPESRQASIRTYWFHAIDVWKSLLVNVNRRLDSMHCLVLRSPTWHQSNRFLARAFCGTITAEQCAALQSTSGLPGTLYKAAVRRRRQRALCMYNPVLCALIFRWVCIEGSGMKHP
jgi:hypothetical protein